MSFLYYFTNINQYSFGLLVFLFAFSFLINKEQIKSIVFIRIFLGFLIFVFYFIGWKVLENGGYYRLLGKEIPYKNKLLKICSMKKINEVFGSNFYNKEIVQKYDCALESANNDNFKHRKEINILTKNKIIQSVLSKNDFTVTSTIKVTSVGLLSNTFGGDYILLIIKDTQNNIYIAGEDIMEEEKE